MGRGNVVNSVNNPLASQSSSSTHSENSSPAKPSPPLMRQTRAMQNPKLMQSAGSSLKKDNIYNQLSATLQASASSQLQPSTSESRTVNNQNSSGKKASLDSTGLQKRYTQPITLRQAIVEGTSRSPSSITLSQAGSDQCNSGIQAISPSSESKVMQTSAQSSDDDQYSGSYLSIDENSETTSDKPAAGPQTLPAAQASADQPAQAPKPQDQEVIEARTHAQYNADAVREISPDRLFNAQYHQFKTAQLERSKILCVEFGELVTPIVHASLAPPNKVNPAPVLVKDAPVAAEFEDHIGATITDPYHDLGLIEARKALRALNFVVNPNPANRELSFIHGILQHVTGQHGGEADPVLNGARNLHASTTHRSLAAKIYNDVRVKAAANDALSQNQDNHDSNFARADWSKPIGHIANDPRIAEVIKLIESEFKINLNVFIIEPGIGDDKPLKRTSTENKNEDSNSGQVILNLLKFNDTFSPVQRTDKAQHQKLDKTNRNIEKGTTRRITGAFANIFRKARRQARKMSLAELELRQNHIIKSESELPKKREREIEKQYQKLTGTYTETPKHPFQKNFVVPILKFFTFQNFFDERTDDKAQKYRTRTVKNPIQTAITDIDNPQISRRQKRAALQFLNQQPPTFSMPISTQKYEMPFSDGILTDIDSLIKNIKGPSVHKTAQIHSKMWELKVLYERFIRLQDPKILEAFIKTLNEFKQSRFGSVESDSVLKSDLEAWNDKADSILKTVRNFKIGFDDLHNISPQREEFCIRALRSANFSVEDVSKFTKSLQLFAVPQRNPDPLTATQKGALVKIIGALEAPYFNEASEAAIPLKVTDDIQEYFERRSRELAANLKEPLEQLTK